MTPPEVVNRRELKTRSRAWPSAVARALARAGVTPNMVSLASIVFAGVSWLAYSQTRGGRTAPWLLVAAAGIQLRLLCNMLDGLLAIEGGLKSKTGDLYNEIPDRVADVMILLGAGLAVSELPGASTLAWSAAILAVLTSYVRLLGGSFGFKQDFIGPMAKQHRMFTLSVGTLAAAIEMVSRGSSWSLYWALWVIAIGSAATLVRRTSRIAALLRGR
jgi:phosphatidylglycerophosphate synthase